MGDAAGGALEAFGDLCCGVHKVQSCAYRHGMSTSGVWMIYCIETDAGAYKIGRTEHDVENRMRDLQTGSPVQLRHRWSVEGGAEIESAIHAFLEPFRRHGEWFDDRSIDIADLASDPEYLRFAVRVARCRPRTKRRLLDVAGHDSLEAFLIACRTFPASTLHAFLDVAEKVAARAPQAFGRCVPFSASLPESMVRQIEARRGERSRSEAAREAFAAWLRVN